MKNNTVAQITESIFNIFSKVDFDFDNGLLTYDEARNRAVQETAEVITTLTQHHQDELAEVYREILDAGIIARIFHDHVKKLAHSRGIDISDKK